MSRLPIRARLTIAFALALALVLAGSGVFVYVRLKGDLDEAVDTNLRARADVVAAVARDPQGALAGPGSATLGEVNESFAQIVSGDGQVLDAASDSRRPVLSSAELARARNGTLEAEREVTGLEGTTRVIARPASDRAGAPVVAVGQSLDDRDEALSGLVASFAVGGPLAVLVASLLGYALATAGLRPVEAMRRRAAEVSLTGDQEQLPLPAAHDEIHRLGETLNAMLARLRSSFERERRFVADASHELRTPVAVLKTELEGALRTGDFGPQVREALVAAVEECDHLAQLAEDLLVIARAAEGGLPVRPEELNARSLLEGVRDRFVDRAEQHSRGIEVDAPADLQLFADPLRLRQALGNLLDNALRHGEGDVRLGARACDSGIELDLADQGAGFDPDIAERAFERFTRGDAARTRGGSGLGMAIVRAVAEAHGGRVAIVPGRETTVRVWLPDAANSGITP